MTEPLASPSGPEPTAPIVPAAAREWWKDAVVYQIYPRSFADLDGNGIGDLRGITSRVPYLKELGVDAVWLSPFYPSALADGGYDVDDYRDVAPEIGTLDDFDEMVAALHGAGIRVMVDLVPNHSSNRHAWFRAALAGGPDAPERELYHFRPGQGPDGELPPNDWRSMFGGSIWERVDDRDAEGNPLTGPGTGRPYQWYLHVFALEQPDLNWSNRAVRDDFLDTLRFWCDRGVDGFRVDVAPGMAKDMSALDRPWAEIPWWPLPEDGTHPMFDRDEVHEIYREWRELLDSYEPPRFAVAEAGVPSSRRPRYAASLGQAFNFQMQDADWTPSSYAWAIEAGLADEAASGSTTWVLGCHDVFRVASRYGFTMEDAEAASAAERARERAAHDAGEQLDQAHDAGEQLDQAHDAVAEQDEYPAGRMLLASRHWVLADGAEPANDPALGERRARAGAMVVMALPGGMYVYQGDELGLPEVPDIPEDRLQDPIAFRNRAVEKGRDGCRVPLPWSASGSSFGFGPDGAAPSHLPQPSGWGEHSVETEEADAASTLRLYREGLRLRHELWGAANTESLTWVERGEHVLAFARGDVQCWTAFGAEVELPDGELLLSSQPVTSPAGAEAPGVGARRVLPADTTAWLRVAR